MRIVMLYNCYWRDNAVSGGDLRYVECLKRWSQAENVEIKLYTTQGFSELLRKEGVRNVEIIIIDDKHYDGSENIIKAYFMRTIKAIIFMRDFQKGDILYAPSDFLPDVIPCILKRVVHPFKVKTIVVIHHIIESYKTRPGNKVSNFISYMQQKVADKLAKHFSDYVFTVSPIVLEYMRQDNWNMDKSFLVSNGVDKDYILSLAEREKTKI